MSLQWWYWRLTHREVLAGVVGFSLPRPPFPSRNPSVPERRPPLL